MYKLDLFLSSTKRQSAFRPVVQFHKFEGKKNPLKKGWWDGEREGEGGVIEPATLSFAFLVSLPLSHGDF